MLKVGDKIKFEDSKDVFVVIASDDSFEVINDRTKVNELGFKLSSLERLSKLLRYELFKN